MKEIEKFLLWLIAYIGGVVVGLVSAFYHNLNSIWICGLIGLVSSVCFQSCLSYFTNKKHKECEE